MRGRHHSRCIVPRARGTAGYHGPMILTIGAGAVGTVLLGALGRHPAADLALYARPKDRAAFEAAPGVRVEDAQGRPVFTAPRPRLVDRLDLQGVDHLLLCVKHGALAPLLEQLPQPSAFPPGCTVVCTLNGVDALRMLRRQLPGVRILPMTIMFNAQWRSPLQAQLATKPALVLGGTGDAALAAAFQGSGMAVARARGDEAVWGKLLINLANAICAVTHATIQDLLTVPALREACAASIEEALAVLRAAGIAFEWPMPIPPSAYLALLRRGGPVTWWLARARNGVREGSYPSMVADIDQRRTTEVLLLNGEIARLGEATGVPTPVASRLVSMVQALEHSPAAQPPRPLPPEALAAALRPA